MPDRAAVDVAVEVAGVAVVGGGAIVEVVAVTGVASGGSVAGWPASGRPISPFGAPPVAGSR